MALTPEQLVYADKMLELKILRADGQAYQDLFVQIMELRDANFRPIKPQGPIGDRKNDGYSAADGVYYQVYAPENHSERNITSTIKKLTNDFAGLKRHWDSSCPVMEYHFVINDKFKGTYPTVELALLKLGKAHRLRQCAPFLCKDLIRRFGELDERAVMSVVGFLPSPDQIPDLDYCVFTDVLNHVIRHSLPVTPQAILRVPDFSEKIRMNGISEPVALLIRTGNLQSGAVDAFFNSHGAFSKRAVRDKLAQIYVDFPRVAPRIPLQPLG